MSQQRLNNGLSTKVAAIEELKAVRLNSGSVMSDKETVDSMFTMQSFDEQGYLAKSADSAVNAIDNITARIRATSFFSGILAAGNKIATGKNSPEFITPESTDAAVQSAAITMLAYADPVTYIEQAHKGPARKDGAVVVNPNQPLLQYLSADSFTMQGFEPSYQENWVDVNATANAMAALQGGFEAAFFPIVTVPGGAGGLEVVISNWHIMKPTARQAQRDVSYDIPKIPLVKAMSDSSLLTDLAIFVTPYVGNDNIDQTVLVDAADVPHWQVESEGEQFATAPIRFGVNVDLLNISAHPGIVNSGTFDETDAIEPIVKIGDVWFRVEFDDGSDVYAATAKYDISRAAGALLQQKLEGSQRRYVTLDTFKVALTDASVLINVTKGGVAATADEFKDALNATVGQAPGSKFQLVGFLELAAQAHTEFANMKVDALSARFDHILSENKVKATSTAVSIEIDTADLGWYPMARRTNSNMRSRGVMLDGLMQNRYVFPVALSSPIMIQQPVNLRDPSELAPTADALAHAQRLLNNNNAHKALLSAAISLELDNGIAQDAASSISSELITPTFVSRTINLEGATITMNSKDNLDNTRGALQSAFVSVANELLNKSGYLAALEYRTGNNTDLEIIAVMNPWIYNLAMESGDPRFLGNGRNFILTQSVNKDLGNDIYMAVRQGTRTNGINPLDFGIFLYTPPLMHSMVVPRLGRMSKEIHMLPCNAHYVTCPVLGRITVEGLEELYFDQL